MSIRRPEQTIQRAVFEHLAVRRAPGRFAFHVPHVDWRSPGGDPEGVWGATGVPDLTALESAS
jgi:hypothetical protein